MSKYAHLLGLEKKRYPTLKELPLTIDLSIEYLGDASCAIALTRQDGLERSQATYFQKGLITYSQLVSGTFDTVSDKNRLKDVFFGQKAFLDWHIHPDNDSRLSPEDNRLFAAFPRNAFIFAVFGYSKGTFLFQTEKSAQLPFSTIFTGLTRGAREGNWNEKGIGYYTSDTLPDPNWGTTKNLNIKSLRLNQLNQFFPNSSLIT